jgi:dephospho-CoA kinase
MGESGRYKAIAYYYLSGHWAVVLDIPLLFESALDLMCGAVLVVSVSSPEVQMRRLLARDMHLSREDAEKRVMSQMAIQEKAERCQAIYGVRGRGAVVRNDGSINGLKEEVGRVVQKLKAGRDGWWKWMLWGLPPVAGLVGAAVVCGNWWWRSRWLHERQRISSKL